MQQETKQIQVKISDEVLKGLYSNTMQVSHSEEEFIMDFMYIDHPTALGTVSAKVIVTPGHLKRMIDALQDNLSKYEQKFGSISQAEQPSHRIGFRSE